MGELQRALDAIEGIKAERSIAGVQAQLARASERFGLSSFCMASMPDPGGRAVEDLVIANWHPEWYRRYVENDYINADPVAAMFHTAREPFTWREARAARTGARADAVNEEAAAFGLRIGFCVPIVTFSGDVVAVSFGGDRPELTDDEQGALHLVAIYAHNRASTLISRPQDGDLPALTPRERECLQWTSVGKTSWEIAQILSISQHTADWYIASATRKLKAVNRIQAVAEGLRRGLIH